MRQVQDPFARHQEFSARGRIALVNGYLIFAPIQLATQHQGTGAATHYGNGWFQSIAADLLPAGFNALVHLAEKAVTLLFAHAADQGALALQVFHPMLALLTKLGVAGG